MRIYVAFRPAQPSTGPRWLPPRRRARPEGPAMRRKFWSPFGSSSRAPHGGAASLSSSDHLLGPRSVLSVLSSRDSSPIALPPLLYALLLPKARFHHHPLHPHS